MAAQSALFGPPKYSILPELVPEAELSRANAAVALCTYLAIIAASGLTPLILNLVSNNYALAQSACVVIATIGLLASLPMGRTKPASSNRRASWLVVDDVWRTMRALRGRNYLIGAILGSAFFSLIGAFMQANVLSYGVTHLGLTQEKSSYLFLIAAAGIGLGSWLAGRISGRLIEFGVVPLGALAMALSSILLGTAPASQAAAMILIALAGVGAGLFLIPLDAFIQRDAPAERRAEAVAAASFIGWLFVLLAQGLIAGNKAIGLTPAGGFFTLGVYTLILSIVAIKILPDFLTRFVVLVMTRLVCRIRVYGVENVPDSGGALIASNHVSYFDAAILIATQQRRLRFIMARQIFEKLWFFKPFFRILNVIQISGDDPPRRLVASIKAARQAINDGFIVAIFPEGRITRTGELQVFRSGMEKIIQNTNAPIIPVYLHGVWGLPTSFSKKRHYQWGRYPVSVSFGAPLPANTPPEEVRNAVISLAPPA
jgi:acyl-[acyl-carrier-protein]-phospholipid O-acyltransferase/long-chain-fatty-acid--[acyl-carrier-protein] ligase